LASYQTNASFNYAISAKLNDASDIDFFSVVTPASGTNAVVFTVTAAVGSKLNPQVSVYDANGTPIDAQILTNDASSFVVQILNPGASTKYFVSVSDDAFAVAGTRSGAYVLGVNYTNTPIVLETLVDDTLSATNTVDVVSMQSTEVQLFHFVLSVDTGGLAPDVAVRMQIFDA